MASGGHKMGVRDARGVGPHVLWFITVREEGTWTSIQYTHITLEICTMGVIRVNISLCSQPNQLRVIRQTLYGSRPHRRSSLQRHYSLCTPGSHGRTCDFTSSVSTSVSHPHQHIPLNVSESLPPSEQ